MKRWRSDTVEDGEYEQGMILSTGWERKGLAHIPECDQECADADESEGEEDERNAPLSME